MIKHDLFILYKSLEKYWHCRIDSGLRKTRNIYFARVFKEYISPHMIELISMCGFLHWESLAKNVINIETPYSGVNMRITFHRNYVAK